MAIRELDASPAPKLTVFINPQSTFTQPINDVYAGPVDVPTADLKAGERYVINFHKVGLTPVQRGGCLCIKQIPLSLTFLHTYIFQATDL